jgi:hypothetical protein
MKEDAFGDNLAVGWRKPSDSNSSLPTEVIPGIFLSASLTNAASNFRAALPVFEISLHPNPAGDILGISVFENINRNIEMFHIYDILGKVVINTKASDELLSDGNYQINVSELTSGMYFLYIITDDNQQQVKKFMKE